MDERTAKEEAKRIPYGMMNRRTKQEQNQACLSYALQEGGQPVAEDNIQLGEEQE